MSADHNKVVLPIKKKQVYLLLAYGNTYKAVNEY